MNRICRALIFLGLILICVGCDQSSKHLALSYLSETGASTAYVFLHDCVRLQLAYNPGAFLSFGAEWTGLARQIMFGIGPVVFMLALMFYVIGLKSITKREYLAYALILAGGISNLLDRFFNHGLVIDFINIGFGWLRTGIFNIADLEVLLGLVLLLVSTSLIKSDAQLCYQLWANINFMSEE